MSTLLEFIRQNNLRGISQSEAEQLFLWLYCTGDILPPALRVNPPHRDELISTFSRLAVEGVIVPNQESASTTSTVRTTTTAWAELLDDLLSGRVSLDSSFASRSKSYLP